MIQYIVFYQTHSNVDDEKRQEMARSSRSILLKIPEVRSVKSGRNVDVTSEWTFFVAIEVDSMKKFKIITEDPHYLKFLTTVVKDHTKNELAYHFELDPTLDVKYS